MGVRLTILLLSVFLLSLGFASAVACADLNTTIFQTLVCGSTPDSALGLGAVDICNVCYPCGVADDVCPEDFYTGTAGRGSCRFCPDPDCKVLIDGVVRDANGNPINNSEIVALYEPDIKEVVNITDSTGYYRGLIRTGFNRLYVRYQDYDSRIVIADIFRLNNGVVKTIDFIDDVAIEPGSCSSSCTDNFGERCKASCDGINACQFNNYTVSNLCDDKIAGTRLFLDADQTKYIICCDPSANVQGVPVYNTLTERLVASVGFRSDFAGGLREGADNLVTFTQRTRSHGERVTLEVAVWSAEDLN